MMRDRHPSVGLGLTGVLLIAGIVVLGAAISLLPVSGLRCPEPAARVVLDPGHVGDDPGAINDAAGLVERELVLDIAQRTKDRLEDAGYSVALTRDDAETGYLNTPRGLIANYCHAFAYVSIHLNSFGEPEPNYAKTFWGRAGPELRQDVLGGRGEGCRGPLGKRPNHCGSGRELGHRSRVRGEHRPLRDQPLPGSVSGLRSAWVDALRTEDREGRLVALFGSDWGRRYTEEKNPGVVFRAMG